MYPFPPGKEDSNIPKQNTTQDSPDRHDVAAGIPPRHKAERLSACTVFTAQGHRRSPAWRRILFRWHHSFRGQGPRHIVSGAVRPSASRCRRAMFHNLESSKKFFQGLVPHQQLPPAQQAG